MKKALLISAIGILTAMQLAAEAAIVPVYDNNILTIEIKTGMEQGEEAQIAVIRKGDEQTAENAYAIDELEADENGVLSFSFEMPEARGEEETYGEYLVYINGEEADSFSFASKATRDELELFLKNASDANAITDALANNEGYFIAAVSLGLDEAVWNVLSDSEKLLAASAFAASQKEGSSAAQFNKYVGAGALSSGKASAESVIAMVNLRYGETPYRSIADGSLKGFIVSYIKNTTPSAENFQKEYDRANVLYLLNNAKYNEINGLIQSSASLLELDGKTQYIKYTNMTEAQKIRVSEEITRQLLKNPAGSISAFETVFNSACITAAAGGSGGSGGGSRGGSTSSIPSNNTSTGVITVINEPEIPENVFDDMTDNWAKDAVMYLYGKGIVSGTDKNEFEPSRNVTREEFVTMLVRAKGIETEDDAAAFTDTLEGAWYNPFINAAVKSGIAYGISEDGFGVGLPITRQDMFTMVSRILEEDSSAVQDPSEFSDMEDISEYAKNAVIRLYTRGIISGTGDGRIEPSRNTTRAEAAYLIYKIIKK